MPAKSKASQSSRQTKIWFISLQASVFANYRVLPRGAEMLISRLQRLQPNSPHTHPCPQLISQNDFVFLGKYFLPSSLQNSWRMFMSKKETVRKPRAGGMRLDVIHSERFFLRLDLWSLELWDTKPYARSASELFCLTVVHVYNFLPGVFCKW